MTQSNLDLPPQRLQSAVALTVATRQGNAAIAAGAAKAKAIAPGFTEGARAHMLAYLRENGTSSGELLTRSCRLAGISSGNDRHFGAVVKGLLADGLIVWAGDCRRTRGHGSRGGSLYSLGEAFVVGLRLVNEGTNPEFPEG